MTDNSRIHPHSTHLAHLIDLFLFKGAPLNLDPDRECVILVNHGYVVGFSPSRLQPLWSAYRVAHANRSTDYDRPHLYYADERLGDSRRLDNRTFGRHEGVLYHVGHMVPNEAINVQFGRLAQMETFFISNMCPQRGALNTGVWLKLENAIRNIEDTPQSPDHVWAVVGPYFSADPDRIQRSDGKLVDVPEGFFCVTIDPFRYPWDRPGNQHLACFMIPQTAPGSASPTDYLCSLDAVEAATRLDLMPGWDAQVAAEARRGAAPAADSGHRLIRALKATTA